MTDATYLKIDFFPICADLKDPISKAERQYFFSEDILKCIYFLVTYLFDEKMYNFLVNCVIFVILNTL